MPRGFVFHKRRGTKFRKTPRSRDIPEQNDFEPPIQPVQGKNPGSVQEWRVAYVLQNMLKVQFEYQKAVQGGRRVRGGQVIDFWIETKPLPTPLYVNGDYWHHGVHSVEDELKVQALIRQFYGQIMMPIIVWEHQLTSMEETLSVLREVLVV